MKRPSNINLSKIRNYLVFWSYSSGS